MSRSLGQNSKIQRSTLYNVVFDVVAVRYVAAFMFLFFVLHPIAPVFASEDSLDTDMEIESSPQDVESVETEVSNEDEEELNEVPVLSEDDDVVSDEQTDDLVDETSVQLENEDVEEVETSTEGENNELADLSKLLSEDDEDVVSGVVAGTSTSQDSGTTTLSHEDVSDVPDEEVGGGSSSSNLDDEEQEDEVLDTEDEITDEESEESEESDASNEEDVSDEDINIDEVPIVVNNQNRHQFSDKECISVGDGSFYCSEIEGAPEYIEDRVFSAPDSDGDMEIFVTIAGETTQITHNLVDDASPEYDGISDTIVWHSMNNDRFQIVQYTVSDGSTEYLTDASYNNTEPVAYGDVVMWQAWVGDNWEIMLLDDGDVVQLTDNSMHDITPQMRDGYIMWQTQFAEGWKVALYDQKTKKVSYIADSDGSGVANPRFVLVYDTTDKVGDVRTLGYDFGSGSSFTLGSLPSEMPDRIPEPDQTGETRALIQAKPSTREGEVEDVHPVPSGTGTSTSSTASSSANVVSDDLVITPLNNSASSTLPVSVDEVVDVTPVNGEAISEEDLLHIDDVVIPPFMGTSTEEVS